MGMSSLSRLNDTAPATPPATPKRKTITFKRPWLYAKQMRSAFSKARYSLTEASTKSGKTVGHLSWLFEQALNGKDGQNFWWVAPGPGVARIAFRRMKRSIPEALYTKNETELFIRLINGAVIWFKSADKPDSLYGEDVYAAVLDEASRMKEDAWHAVRTTLTYTQGLVRIIGNVKGKRNWFYILARKAQVYAESIKGKRVAKPQFAYAKITAADAVKAGILKREEIEDAESVLPESVFKELYNAEASDDTGNPFGFEWIKACIVEKLSGLPAVVYGIDLAKSFDWTVIIGLDQYGHVCKFYRFQKPWVETIAEIHKIVGKVECWVDSTGVGDVIVEQLQRPHVRIVGPPEPVIVTQEDKDKAQAIEDNLKANEVADMMRATLANKPHVPKAKPTPARRSNFHAYLFTAPSKQQLMEGLAVAIQGEEVHFPEGALLTELELFEYEYYRGGVKYSAPEGMHDDCVCALALAWHGKRRPKLGPGIY